MTYNDAEKPPGTAVAQGVRTEGDAADDFDLLYGVPAIAAHMRMKAPQVRHLIAKGAIPTFKLGKPVCARRSTLNAWLAECEAKARAGGGEANAGEGEP